MFGRLLALNWKIFVSNLNRFQLLLLIGYIMFLGIMTVNLVGTAIVVILLDVSGLSRIRSRTTVLRKSGRITLREGPAHIQPCAFAGLDEITLLLPKGLPAEHRKHTVLHELMHIRHGDLQWNWIGTVAACLFAWNPAYWVWRVWHRHQSEHACDQKVIARRNVSQHAYSASLLDLAQRYAGRVNALPVQVLGGSLRRPSILRSRIEHMVAPHGHGPTKRAGTAFIVLVLMANVALATIDVTVRPWSVANLALHTNINLGRLSALNLAPPYGLVLDY